MESKRSYVVGLMSGTSLDGVDACVVEVTEPDAHDDQVHVPRLQLVGFLTEPYSRGVREGLMRLSAGGTVGDVCSYNVLLGQLFAEAARTVVARCGMTMTEIDLIGSHGQTVLHQPTPLALHGYLVSSTLQIGDPSVIANVCGVTTVGDFRPGDMAAGGQGAPLAPYLDHSLLQMYYREQGRVGILVNVGGVSNLSVYVPPEAQSGTLPEACGDRQTSAAFIGFDCGPGNILIDSLVCKWFSEDFDRDGIKDTRGSVSGELLDWLLQDSFLYNSPPKSTGREYYGSEYAERIVGKSEELQLPHEDSIATVTEFTVAAIWKSYEQFVLPYVDKKLSCDLFVSGGGARNPTLMRFLKGRFSGCCISSTDDLGIDPDAKEAMCFALLAYQTYRGRPTNMPSVTGSREGVILGKICPVLQNQQH